MFLDIRNFTPFAETKTPEAVVSYLNSLFGFMIDVIERHHGTRLLISDEVWRSVGPISGSITKTGRRQAASTCFTLHLSPLALHPR
jgi:class 3 adenylate cyclase